MSSAPLERISWSLYCPFPKVQAFAEFTYADKGRKNGNRYSKMRGRTYASKRYDVPMDVMSIDLGSDDYFAIKHMDQHDDEGRVSMTYPHLVRFVSLLEEALEAARDGSFEKVGENYRLTPKGSGDGSVLIAEDLVGGSFVAFQPVVVIRASQADREDAQERADETGGEPGMRMYLNSWSLYSDVGLEDYTSFAIFCERFDLFATSRAAMQVAVSHLGGVPGVAAVARTAAPQPKRLTATGLGQRRK